MKRRNFIKNMARASAVAPFVLNGVPMQAFGTQDITGKLNSEYDHRKLVLIELHGGNDGLNMLVPIPQYGEYESLRQNIAIPNSGPRKYVQLDSTLPFNQRIGLHPDMGALKALYEEGKVRVVQSVGYENVDKSHFRGRDIWMMGGNYNEYKTSGWMGRYLDNIYPDYPTAYPTAEMPDPLGLEIGNTVSLGFHRETGIPAALANSDPANFNALISGLGSGAPTNIPANQYGDELQHIIDLYANANQYAAQLESRYNAGSNYAVYPGAGVQQYAGPTDPDIVVNPLAWQLQTVARLINGGCQTKIYMVRLGSFDTHNAQAIQGNTTYGYHAALLYHLSTAIKSFMDDLAASGKDEEVVGCTFSEFGRRPYSNSNHGTDHGTAAPMLVFGKAVEPGVIGDVDLNSLDSTGNLMVQTDYRQVFGTLLVDWLGADDSAVEAAEFQDFVHPLLRLINDDYHTTTSIEPPVEEDFEGIEIYPNPVQYSLHGKLHSTDNQTIKTQIIDATGRLVRADKFVLEEGNNTFSLDIYTLSPGTYFLKIITKSNNKMMAVKKFLKR